MLQLAEMLRADGKEGGRTRGQAVPFYTIWFNAWRFSEDEALWAAFSLALMQQLNAQVPFWRRVWANLGLLLRRFDVEKGKWALLRIAGFLGAVVVYYLIALEQPSLIRDVVPEAVKQGVTAIGGLGLLAWAATKAKELFGNPLEQDLKKYVRDPHYHEKLSFGERFQ